MCRMSDHLGRIPPLLKSAWSHLIGKRLVDDASCDRKTKCPQGKHKLLRDKVAMVTGGARGIGCQIVREFLEAGAMGVAIADINQRTGEELVQNLEHAFGKGRTLFIKCDIRKSQNFDWAYKQTLRRYKQLNVVVNNAGVLNDPKWETTISTNICRKMGDKVAVIGAGVIGLTTAVRIQKECGSGVKVTILTADKSPNTTGDVAAGLWAPYLLQDTPADKITQWSKETKDLFLQLWRDGYASEAGISLHPMIYLWCDDRKLPEWSSIAIGCSEIKSKELECFRRDHKIPYTGGFTFLTLTCEAKKFLPFLEAKFLKNGGNIKMEKIDNFSQLAGYNLIVNCTGMYSKILMNDNSVKAIRGQIIRVEAPWQFHTVIDDSDDGCYIIPNETCVILGGTHQLDDEDTKPRSDDASRILKGCKEMIPSLHEARILKHQAGLRPGRDQIRLELSSTTINGQSIPVIHNYGHGGSGITLCYGCAGEAADLVKLALAKSKL